MDLQQKVGGSLQLIVMRLAMTLLNTQEKHMGLTIPLFPGVEPGSLISKMKLMHGTGIEEGPSSKVQFNCYEPVPNSLPLNCIA